MCERFEAYRAVPVKHMSLIHYSRQLKVVSVESQSTDKNSVTTTSARRRRFLRMSKDDVKSNPPLTTLNSVSGEGGFNAFLKG